MKDGTRPVKKRPPRKRQPKRKPPSAFRQRLERVRRIVGVIPPSIRTIILLTVAAGLFLLANLVYHVIHKPTEMLYPVSGVMKKSPTETWREYGPLFREYSTANISPELLAALAQVEGAGDPIAHTYWRWQLAWPPFEIYKPASSAVGMYQMTEGTFADASRWCIRNHAVIARDSSCWSEDFYNRLLPAHAIELTSAHLDRSVAAILGQHADAAKLTAKQKQDLAALTHLCGAGAARDYARHGFKLAPGAMCGDHSAEIYAGRVETMVEQFRKLAARD